MYAGIGTEKVTASPGARSSCPGCGAVVIAKCGDVNAWHWAHEARECDAWHEPESAWHLRWKSIMRPECVEVAMGPHRADIRTADGMVVELQHSNIDVKTIQERERFYGRMRWIFDASEWNLDLRDRGDFISFRWKHPHRSIRAVRAPMLWDLGRGFLLRVKRLDVQPPSGGWGHLVHVSDLARSPSAAGLTDVARGVFAAMSGSTFIASLRSMAARSLTLFPNLTHCPGCGYGYNGTAWCCLCGRRYLGMDGALRRVDDAWWWLE